MLMFYSMGIYMSALLFDWTVFFMTSSVFGTIFFLLCYTYSESANGKFYNSMAMSTCIGMTSGHFVEYTNTIDPIFVPFSLAMTMSIFVAFTIVSRYIDDYKSMILGSIFGTLLNMLIVVSLFSIFIRLPKFSILIQMITGLLTFCGYIVYDTKRMQTEFIEGNIDYYKHAISLFLDFINVFINFLTWLVETKKNTNENTKRVRFMDDSEN